MRLSTLPGNITALLGVEGMTGLRIDDDVVLWSLDGRRATAQEALAALHHRPLLLVRTRQTAAAQSRARALRGQRPHEAAVALLEWVDELSERVRRTWSGVERLLVLILCGHDHDSSGSTVAAMIGALAESRIVPFRIAPLRSAPVKSASRRSAPVRSAPVRSAPTKEVPMSFE